VPSPWPDPSPETQHSPQISNKIMLSFLETSQNYEKYRRATIYEIFFGEFEIHFA